MHDLATIDLIRSRMDVGYQQAMEALDQAEGDAVGALAILEETTQGGLHRFQRELEEGVKRGLSGEQIETIRWKLQGQVVKEVPVALAGAAAVVVAILSLLVSSSTVETEYAKTEDEPEETLE
ncbi:MAG: hypothetical protein WCP21_13055 [Armatimonadota bacterium]